MPTQAITTASAAGAARAESPKAPGVGSRRRHATAEPAAPSAITTTSEAVSGSWAKPSTVSASALTQAPIGSTNSGRCMRSGSGSVNAVTA